MLRASVHALPCPLRRIALQNEETTLSATIEKGMSDGAEIKFPRKSEQSPGQVPGDVVMQLKQQKHALYTRAGNDLHVTMTISLKEALLGFEKSLKHLDDHEVRLAIGPVHMP